MEERQRRMELMLLHPEHAWVFGEDMVSLPGDERRSWPEEVQKAYNALEEERIEACH
jgi:hypothetical protein